MGSLYRIRWCKISDHYLYYGNDPDDKSRGSLDLYEMDFVEPRPSNTLKLTIQSTTKKWAYSLAATHQKERDAWLAHLEVWTVVQGPNDPIRIPKPLADGLLASLEFCMFYGNFARLS
jgi:hypothetical protein